MAITVSGHMLACNAIGFTRRDYDIHSEHAVNYTQAALGGDLSYELPLPRHFEQATELARKNYMDMSFERFADTFIVATETGMLHPLAKENPSNAVCPHRRKE